MTARQIPSKNKMIKTKVSMPLNSKAVLKDEEKVKKLSLVDVEQALFQPYPSKLIFQNFTPGETFKLPLQLFNRDKSAMIVKVPRYVKLEHQESEYFHVAGPEDASGKVAPGLSANYTVLFSPHDNKDYQHRLVFVTERERFEIPVVAIGPRAILDFRDELLLSVCHVKATTEKTQLVRNIGNSKANFKLHTKEPFSVMPTSGSLDVGESIQVTVTFSPMSVGDHRQDLLLYYHTGEVVCISLFGACEELDVQFESDLVLLDKTYMSLSSVQIVSLTNTSRIPLRYYWTKQPRCREQEEDKPRHAIHHSGPPSTTAQNSLSDLSNEGAITLEPMAGEIWPNVTAEFCIIFKPVAATLYQQTLYCDITGRESPLCLTIKGEGLGPKLEPNYTVMDMKNICIGDNDWYEVTLTNKGLIDAPFKMSSPNTTFGHFFSFSPVEDVVPPGACHTVKVTFSSSVSGTFSEDLLLTVNGQPCPKTLNFRLQISNEGTVELAFSWKVQIDHRQTDENVTSLPSSGSSNAVTRPSSATESVVSLLSINPELVPFTVEPCIGTIKPEATQGFEVHFSPLEVSQFEGILICSIPNLHTKDQSPSVSVSGGSMMPSCHFDLEDSNYISGSCHNSEFRSPLELKTRVVEFIAVGLSALSTKRFFALNPTNKPYSFKWRCEDSTESSFRCLTQSGILQPKEKAEVHLEYISEQMDVVESSWSFVIETLSVSVPFLFVGTTREPLIYLDKALINFGDLLVGNKAEQTVHLVNTEEEPFHFSVLQSSLLCEDQLSSLIIHPMSSTLGPKERCSLAISFAPNRQGYFSFRVFLKVKRRLEPLALTVKADCFSLGTLVEVENPSGDLRELRPNHIDSIDFERVGISEQSSFRFFISNLAKCELNITFNVAGPRNLVQHLKAEPKHATVEVGKQLQLSLSFCPLSVCNLQDIRLSIKVKNGATFTFDVKGKGTVPSLDFSFTKLNFGKCFIHSSGMLSPTQTLVIRNKDKRDISVLCLFENTSYLEIGFQPSILASGADLKIPITFSPQETRRYHEKLNFILNSCVTRQVEILGHGIELKLEVEDPKNKIINFGSLKLGKKLKKRIVLVNHSTVSLCFSLLLNSNSLTTLDPKDLSVSPTGQLNLKASESCAAVIQFCPRQHVPKFTVELQAETLGLLHPLLSVRGSCQGIEVHLDQNHLAFGSVVQHGKTSRKIVMINTGDIGGKFCWKTEKFPSSLCISPTKGFIGPGMEVPFEVVFAPVQLSDESRFENLPCILEGCSSPLTLTVTGSCVMAPVKEVMNFVCPVRNSHTQSLSVLNPTNQSCTIRPVIEGEQWTGAPAIVLEPLQNKIFEITYLPFTMTSEMKKHLGSVFFSFLDGTGLLYSLQGTAEAPKAEDTIVHGLPAKTHHTEVLSVHNWLLKPQRFRVLLEIVKPDKPDATVSLSGLEFIDVPALTKRDYNLSFFAYKTGQYNTKVTFCNEASGEYLFYLVTFKATTSLVQSTVELVTTVRQPVSATVHITNPLATNVCLTTECKCSDISVPLQHTVPGHSTDALSFEYLPLQVGKTTVRLTLSSNELGYFYYDLCLRALPPPLEKKVNFTASLGTSHSVIVKFTNFSRTKTEYLCKTDCPDFFVDKSVTAVAGFQAGSETSVEVCFEPHQMGEVRAWLTLSSAAGGEYTFPLHGVCQPPKPQGPFSISVGRVVPLPFKNVFLQNTAFSYQVNNPSFTVKGPEIIHSKKTQNVFVSFESPPGGGSGPWFGKLTISSQPSGVHTKPCTWVFFLKGCRMPSS